MAFDGVVLRSLETEFKSILIGSKIDKIHQPEKDEIIMNIRNGKSNLKLLISASSNNPRVYLTETTKQNPTSPPMFCMLLRKHIQGGIITDIYQIDLERILVFEIQSLDEMGYMSKKNLLVEIMNKHSNIILVKKEDNKIIDSIKRIPINTSSLRQVLPGLEYYLPPSQKKINPLFIDRFDLLKLLKSSNSSDKAFKFLYKNFLGMSPLLAREIVYHSQIDDELCIKDINEEDITNLCDSFLSIYANISSKNFDPTIIIDENNEEVIDFSAIDLNQFGCNVIRRKDTMNKILDLYYESRDRQDRVKQKSSDLRKNISTKKERLLNKVQKQELELRESKEREKYKIMADLIMANLYKINKGDSSVEIENFYDPKLEVISINLDPKISASDNAQKYYKKYNKLKHASNLLTKEILKSKEEISYLDNIIFSIDNSSSIDEIEEIREELTKEGYLKSYHKKNKRNKTINSSKPYHYISSSGLDIYVGKNNIQNDRLTLKVASKDDLWFHTKDIPGSHVILKNIEKQIDENSIKEAALLAAFYSKGNMSENVAVDYTERRNVKKPSGSKPGMVIYENNKTIYVTPDKERLRCIKKAEDS